MSAPTSDLRAIPDLRIRTVNDAPASSDGEYVLYWMIAQRRLRWNFALDHALFEARRRGQKLLILEALRCGYPWASDRLHQFVIDGMAANARQAAEAGVRYFAYIEPEVGDGKGLLEALAARASLVVTDEFPCFFLPRMVEAAGRRLNVRLDAVDSNGLLPLRAAEKVYKRAVDLRRFLQKTLPPHLLEWPSADPLAKLADDSNSLATDLPEDITTRWADWSNRLVAGERPDLATLPIDHHVPPVQEEGGSEAARARLHDFLELDLPRYQDGRLDLENPSTSRLSPYLHFGHISAHEIFAELIEQESWQPDQLGEMVRGQREGWWGMGENAEAFLDELITWRELGYNNCHQLDDYDQFTSLPEWAQRSLHEHLSDERSYVYDLETFERAETHDELWNAAQRELVRDGRIHNYLRMLWGKKILEWSATPQDALDVMIELNNKYAVDGRNPNSYSGIFWVLGRHDRAWGPERPIFGKVRFMSSDSARRKLKLGRYLERYSA